MEKSFSDEWVLFPEGMISGYYPEETDFLDQLKTERLEQSLNELQDIVKKKNLACLIGSALWLNDDWYNCTVFLTGEEKTIYRKNNLSALDRDHFSAGKELCVYQKGGLKFGIQMCRELAFPEQWKVLKKQGAQVILHLNNAVKESDKVREQILVARAFENQLWVCSVNNAAPPQAMSSMIADPNGNVVWKSIPQKEETYATELDLSLVSNHYLQQERTDLVEVVLK